MEGEGYGYVGEGRRIHIIRSGQTTYCDRTISSRAPDPEAIPFDEVCKTCRARLEEAGREETGSTGKPEEETARTEEGSEEPTLLVQWDRLAGWCERRFSERCAPVLIAAHFALLVLVAQLLWTFGPIQSLVGLLLLGGGAYAYLCATGRRERWDRSLDAWGRLFAGLGRRLLRLLS